MCKVLMVVFLLVFPWQGALATADLEYPDGLRRRHLCYETEKQSLLVKRQSEKQDQGMSDRELVAACQQHTFAVDRVFSTLESVLGLFLTPNQENTPPRVYQPHREVLKNEQIQHVLW